MKTKQTEILEKYFKTENEHYNKFTFKMISEVLKGNEFEDPEIPLHLFSNSIDLFVEHCEHPLKAVQLFSSELDRCKLNAKQKLFISKWSYKYLTQSEFDDDLTAIQELLKIQKERLEIEVHPIKVSIKDTREMLKETIEKELQKLPDILQKLEPVQRLNILCKLMPFIFPKVESIDATTEETNVMRV